MQPIDTVIVGAGHAGLAMSNLLTGQGVEHVILERDGIASRWRNERWDSFTLLTPNWATWLPNWRYDGEDQHGFMGRDDVVSYLESYAASFGAPVRTGVEVESLESANGDGYRLRTSEGELTARSVVVATGPFQQPRLPAWSTELPADVLQMHSSAYRSPAQLPDGAVLVVGTGPSGQQIAEDMLRAGRRAYLCVGNHKRVPRSYRGRDHYWWLELGGFFEGTAAGLSLAERGSMVGPGLTGVGGGHELDLREMHARGLTLLGHASGVVDGRVQLDANLAASLAQGDKAYGQFTAWVEARLTRFDGLYGDPAPREQFPDPPEPPTELDLKATGITTVVWATGFTMGFHRWINLPALDEHGFPVHERGASPLPGLYFMGLPWQHRMRSPFIRGAEEDARHLAKLFAARRAT